MLFKPHPKHKCRDPRCSFACYRNWSFKQGSIFCHFLETIRNDFQFFRGSFRFGPDSSERDVDNIKKAFLYELRKWKRRKANRETTFEINAIAHCTNANSLHYDFIAYASKHVSAQHLISEIRQLWRTAGGFAITLVEQEDSRLFGQGRYLYKLMSQKRFRRKRIFLLRRNGLRISWQTKTFFQGKRQAQLWREVRVEWFGEDEVKQWELMQQRTGKNPTTEDTKRAKSVVNRKTMDSSACCVPKHSASTIRDWDRTEKLGLISSARAASTVPHADTIHPPIFLISGLLPLPPPCKKLERQFSVWEAVLAGV